MDVPVKEEEIDPEYEKSKYEVGYQDCGTIKIEQIDVDEEKPDLILSEIKKEVNECDPLEDLRIFYFDDNDDSVKLEPDDQKHTQIHDGFESLFAISNDAPLQPIATAYIKVKLEELSDEFDAGEAISPGVTNKTTTPDPTVKVTTADVTIALGKDSLISSASESSQRKGNHLFNTGGFECSRCSFSSSDINEFLCHLSLHDHANSKEGNPASASSCEENSFSANQKEENPVSTTSRVKNAAVMVASRMHSIQKIDLCGSTPAKNDVGSNITTLHLRGMAYTCVQCSYSTNSSRVYMKHMNNHKKMSKFDKPKATREGVFQCSICEFSSVDINKFLNHTSLHKTYLGDLANAKIGHHNNSTSNNNNNNNNNNSDSGNKIKLAHCNQNILKSDERMAVKKYAMSNYVRILPKLPQTRTRVNPFILKKYCCSFCSYSCSSSKEFLHHMNYHARLSSVLKPVNDINLGGFVCCHCDYSTLDMKDFLKHTSMHESDDRRFDKRKHIISHVKCESKSSVKSNDVSKLTFNNHDVLKVKKELPTERCRNTAVSLMSDHALQVGPGPLPVQYISDPPSIPCVSNVQFIKSASDTLDPSAAYSAPYPLSVNFTSHHFSTKSSSEHSSLDVSKNCTPSYPVNNTSKFSSTQCIVVPPSVQHIIDPSSQHIISSSTQYMTDLLSPPLVVDPPSAQNIAYLPSTSCSEGPLVKNCSSDSTEGQYQCSECAFTCSSVRLLLRHATVHRKTPVQSSGLFYCSHCTYCTLDMKTFLCHNKDLHS